LLSASLRYDLCEMVSEATRTLAEHKSAAGATVLHVRGSLVVSSLQTLRELNLYTRYIAHLPAAMHDAVLYALASSWLPCDVALAHYGACNAMELGEHELKAVGEHVARRILGTFLGTLLRGSRLFGANMRPIVALENYPRLWDRLLQGGGCTTRQTGPKDATIDSWGVPMFRYPYFRLAYQSLIRGAGLMFGNTMHIRALRSTDTSLTIALSWV
jgi:hypothetical protein